MKVTGLLAAVFVFFLAINAGAAEYVKAEPLTRAEAQIELDRLKGSQAGIETMLARVRQKKTSPLLEKEAVTTGSILLKRPNLLRWEVDSPEKLIVVVDGQAMWVYWPSKKLAEKRLLANDPAARYTMSFMSSSMKLSLEDISSNFNAAVYRDKDKDSTLIELKPRSKMVARFLRSVEISYGPEGLPQWFRVESADGGVIHTEFEDINVNAPSQADAFTLKLPRGVEVRTLGEEEVR